MSLVPAEQSPSVRLWKGRSDALLQALTLSQLPSPGSYGIDLTLIPQQPITITPAVEVGDGGANASPAP